MSPALAIGLLFLGELLALGAAFLLGGRNRFEAGYRLGLMESDSEIYREGLADGIAWERRRRRALDTERREVRA